MLSSQLDICIGTIEKHRMFVEVHGDFSAGINIGYESSDCGAVLKVYYSEWKMLSILLFSWEICLVDEVDKIASSVLLTVETVVWFYIKEWNTGMWVQNSPFKKLTVFLEMAVTS